VSVGRLVVIAALAGCGVRAPSAIDVDTLVRTRGPVEARRDLLIRILADPKDIAARLALARIDEVARPGEAIEQLAAVEALGGPIGTRWHDDDRALFGRLLAARGHARAVRGAASALADLDHARRLGATISRDDDELAKVAIAVGELRHSDGPTRADGRRRIAALSGTPRAAIGWRGSRDDATLLDRANFGTWLWANGARRAAWEELSAWHDGTPAPRDAALQAAYLTAYGWWKPVDLPPPPETDLVGPERCRFVACRASDMVSASAVALAMPLGRTTDPSDANAWVEVTLAAALHGRAAWGPAIAARVDLAAVEPKLAPYTRPIVARLLGHHEPVPAPTATSSDGERLVIAAERALDGAGAAVVRATLGAVADTPDGQELVAIAEATAPHRPTASESVVTPPARSINADAAAVRYALARVPDTDPTALAAIAAAFSRDPGIAERLGRDLVAASVDAAVAHAALGAMFDALADPGRARVEWQAAVDASPEVRCVLGLAAAQARAGDADAALITTTTAAAASGDPAAAWNVVAAALVGRKPQQALDAARSAIELAGPDTLAQALEIAIAASQALGRTEQVASLRARLSRVVPLPREVDASTDPTDPSGALVELRNGASAPTLERAWIASRWNPRDVALRVALHDSLPANDPRRATIDGELAVLAGDADQDRGLAASVVLR
jgi:hypothetical protein